MFTHKKKKTISFPERLLVSVTVLARLFFTVTFRIKDFASIFLQSYLKGKKMSPKIFGGGKNVKKRTDAYARLTLLEQVYTNVKTVSQFVILL